MTCRGLLIALFFFAASVTPVHPQEDDEPRGPGRAVELEVHGGFLRFDGTGMEPTTGGRLVLHLPSGLGFGASAAFARRPVEIDDEPEEADAWIVSADLSYLFPSVARANFFGSLGVGAARFDASPAELALGGEDVTELVVPLGFGVLWYNHPGEPWWAVRADVRDNIVFLNGDEDLGTDDAIANDWELTVGLSFLFGEYD